MKKNTQYYISVIYFIFLLFCFFITSIGFSQTLQVSGNNTVIINGDTTPSLSDFTDFGSVASGTKFSHSFVLKNTGGSNLVFPATPVVTSGTDASQFKVTTNVVLKTSTYGKYLANNLSPNFYTIIEISFEPTSTGLKTATLTINLSTGSPNPYSYTIQGTGNTPSTPDFIMTQLNPNLTFNYPYELFYGPDNYLWITERVGKRVVRVNPTTSAVDVLVTIPDVYRTGGQDGLMGMVLDPDFGKSLGKDYVYVAYTYSNTGAAELAANDATRRTKIVRYTYTGGGIDGNMSDPYILIDGLSGSNDHNSGRLAVGPDKKIYYSIGDQGVNQFTNKCNLSHAQDIPSLDQVNSKNYSFYEGKVLRLDLDGKIPTDNPTINGVKSHIFTYGHRNVQGLVFGKNGKFYASEHGPKSDDEINILKSGGNYGWPFISGYKDDKNYAYGNWSTATNCSSVSFSDDDFAPGMTGLKESDWTVAFTPPITTLFTIPDGFNSTGGWLTWPTVGPSSAGIYEGFASEIPGWDNTVLLTTLKKGRVYRQKLSSDGNGVVGAPEEFFYTQNRYRDLAIDPDGKTFYIITDSGGTTSGPSGSSSLGILNPGTILKFTYQPSNMVSCSAPVPTIASLPTITDNCSVTLTAPTATNNCSGTITASTTTTFPITTLGTTVVTWTYNYGNGLTITQNQSVTITTTGPLVLPTFTQIGQTCSGDVLAALPTTSNNGITGTWSPTINNTTSATYTFTSTTGQCAATATMTISISAKVTPLFNAIAPICSGLLVSPLATTSLNGITGTWSPAFSNTTTKSYTFTPSGGQCTATTAVVTITVNSSTTPTFTAVPAICSGASLSPLPITSNNGIFGTWSPTLSNTSTTTYTFNPTAGQCASTTTLKITVNAGTPTTPTFTAVAAICAGATLAALPTTSTNGITGTWSPALNNVATTTYTFTPTAGLCAKTTTLTITVNANAPTIPTFNTVNPICSGGTLAALPTTSLNAVTGTWSPALTKTATTTYTFTPTAGLCATTAILTVIVNPANTVPTFIPVGPICSGTVLAALPTTSNNSIAGTWAPALINTNLTAAPVTTTYTFTPTANQCATSTSLSITVNPNVIPTFTAVAPICYGDPLTALPTTSNNYITGTWSPALNNLATTTYTFTPTAGQCATTTTLTITVNSTAWNGSTWSNGTPISGVGAIISGNLTLSSDLTACSLTINNNAVVLVKSGSNLNIYGDVNVSAGSSLTFENNTNLVQTKTTNGNTGNIIVNRQTSALMRQDYVMWTAPVAGQQLQLFSPATLATRFYTYDPSANLYAVVSSPSTIPFALGTGYLIRMPNTHPTTPTIWEGQFQGVPNNGTIDLIGYTSGSYNAIGNPYPSTLDADTFRSINGITEALYFWRKTNNAASTSYATYTIAGGVANTGGGSSLVPSKIIQVGQGFIAKLTSGTIHYDNTMRLSNNANLFLKTKAIERDRIWLNLSAGTSPVNQMMVAYMDGATSGIDDAIDGRYINDNPTALNSNINDEEFVIQGKGLPFDPNDVVPLIFKTNTAGSFTIAIDHFDGLFSNGQDIFLKDNTTGIDYNLKAADYTFTSAIGTFNNRFQLTYESSTALGVNNPNFLSNTILVYKQNAVININAGKTIIKNVKVFDIKGSMILEQKNVNSSTTTLKNLISAKQTLLIQITSEEGKMVTKKVMY